MTPTDGELTPDEQDALRHLPREADPPRRLEDATLAALRARGLLRPSRPRGLHPALALAASLALFLGGLAVGRAGDASSPPADGRPRFALLLYEGPGYEQPAPGATARRVQEYVSWARQERSSGVVEGGEKLREDVDLVVEPGGTIGQMAPQPAESRLTGYFLVRAADRRAAVEIARTCPHVRYGGTIVVREIDPT